VDYFGNVKVGETGDLTLENLHRLGVQAILVTTGAQGTKWLGLPGEALDCVYHAKDLVYHYNLLPPFSQQTFCIGRRVAVVGVGNVMLEMVHYLADVHQVDEIIAIARRGPAEVKFDKKELEFVVSTLDLPAFEAEIERVTPVMQSLGEDPDQFLNLVKAALKNAIPLHTPSHFKLMFLASPVAVLEENARVCGLELEDNTIYFADGEIKARGLGTRHTLAVDTVIFAIGDSVDAQLGLPISGFEYVMNPVPRFPVEGISYEVFDPKTKATVQGVFVAGWSRQASTGVVGLARKDGINGAKALLQYLEALEPVDPAHLKYARQSMRQLKPTVVTASDLIQLRAAEEQQAQLRGLSWFKFSTNQEMLAAIGKAG
jgi:ferredoxin--NADP+ reductase